MIYVSTEESFLSSRIGRSESLSTGMDFLRLMDEQSLLTGGVESAIVGGAVRDVLFHNTTPNDIDIFLYKASVGNNMSPSLRAALQDVDFELARENIILWLEDQEIEYTSLISDRAAEYFGGNRFLEILDFNWRDKHFQIMIPSEGHSAIGRGLDWLLGTMPTYSKLCLTLDYFYASNAGVACQFMAEKPLCIETDIMYLRNKFPNERYIRFSNSTDLVFHSLRNHVLSQPISSLQRGVMPPRGNTPSDLLEWACETWIGNITVGTIPPYINPRRPELVDSRRPEQAMDASRSMFAAFENRLSSVSDGIIRPINNSTWGSVR